MIADLWLVVIILAYLFFALSSLGDKLVLSGPPKAGSYTFYVGVLSALVIFLMPFTNFGFPTYQALFWIVLDALVHIAGLYIMYLALEKFEVSKVITTIGATQPVFIFAIAWMFFGPQTMSQTNILAFILLFLGSVIISFDLPDGKAGKKKDGAKGYLTIALISSLMFSLDYVFQKQIFLQQTFLQGLIWMRIFIFLFCMVFLFSKKTREEIFKKKEIANKKTGGIFAFAQISGGLANILQSFAIALVPVALLPIVNSLRGIQYIFLFLITLFLTFLFPKILKEKISKKIAAQKVISIILIAIGFWLLIAPL